MKITRTKERRKITLDEFIAQKSSPEYAPLRLISKSLNFLLIFGGSAKVFSEGALETSWTYDQVLKYIEDNNCYEELIRAQKVYRRESSEKQHYIAVAMRLRDNFFKAYPNLMKRIERERKFAAQHGYIRSVFGATRNVIELYLKGEFDQKELSGMIRNLENICANTSVQNMEAAVTKRFMYEIQCWLKEKGLKSWLWNEIHDSIDIFVYKKEIVPVLWMLKTTLESPVAEFVNLSPIRLKVDCEVSDLKKGEYYKGGVDASIYLPEGLTWENIGSLTEKEAFSYLYD